MQTLTEIRALLTAHALRPKHRLGQNFLHDQNQLRKLIEAAEMTAGDLVLEVGPGTGTLTEALLEAGARVVACELDGDMAAIIEAQFADSMPARQCSDSVCGESARLELVRGDALAKSRALNPEILERLAGRPFKLIANLPYQIASPLMTTLLIDHPGCLGQFVTIQSEVADRLLAAPSTKAYGPLSVMVKAFAEVRRIGTLSPSCFWPEPEVTSAMVAITPKAAGQGARHLFLGGEGREFARFVTGLFSKRRKQLGTTIGRAHAAWPALERSGVTPDLRPEALSVEQMIDLWRASAT